VFIRINMQTDIMIAGAGGQGVLFAGTVLAWACIEEGKHTTWFPSYGAEVRGGTVNSSVIISDEDIGSPIAVKPSVLISLDEASVTKFVPKLQDNAVAVINSSLVKPEMVTRKDTRKVFINATEIADKEVGDIRTANMVMLGAYIRATGILKLESVKKACEKALEGKEKLVPINQKAIELGFNCSSEAQSSGTKAGMK
jgi:2-oxoglutarate ferredoxin oxidoreductase subunit gamma